MSWDESKHQAMRKWAVHPDNNYKDPEELIIRNGKAVIYKNKSCMKAYKRIESIYDETKMSERLEEAKRIQERAKHAT